MLKPTLAIPFLKERIPGLKQELPLYLTKSSDIPESTDCLQWWKTYATELPVWSSAAQLVLLVQPSSDAAERVFSLLNSSFTDQQDLSLQDYVETSIMLQYNKRSQ